MQGWARTLSSRTPTEDSRKGSALFSLKIFSPPRQRRVCWLRGEECAGSLRRRVWWVPPAKSVVAPRQRSSLVVALGAPCSHPTHSSTRPLHCRRRRRRRPRPDHDRRRGRCMRRPRCCSRHGNMLLSSSWMLPLLHPHSNPILLLLWLLRSSPHHFIFSSSMCCSRSSGSSGRCDLGSSPRRVESPPNGGSTSSR